MQEYLLDAVHVRIAPLARGARRCAVQRRLQLHHGVVHRTPQVRQVESAEQPVPVGVVGLRAVQQVLQSRRALSGWKRLEARGQLQHALVHPVGLAVARQEVAPDPSAQERFVALVAAVVALLLYQVCVGVGARSWQRPLVHFDVGRGGQVDHPVGRALVTVLVEVQRADQGRGEHALDELPQPASLVHPLVGLRPDSELLDIVEVDGSRAWTAVGHALDKAHDLGGGGEGDAVAQRFRNGEQLELAAVLFRAVVADQFFDRLAGAQKVVVVDRDILDSRVYQRRHYRAFPHSLGQPSPLGTAAHQVFQAVRQGLELTQAVARWNGSEHRFHVTAAEQLRLSALHHLA